MGRLPRVIDDGLVYHAFNRGNNRGDVFTDDAGHGAFLDALARTKAGRPFLLFGYCLMSNHFHLLLKPEAGQTISRIQQSLAVAHTWRYHKRHQSSGHVWHSETNVKNELTPINRAIGVARALGLGDCVTLQAARSEPTTEVSDR